MTSTKAAKTLIIVLAITSSFTFLTSCNSSKNLNRDFLYFQRGLDSLGTIQQKETVIKTNDILLIQVSSKSSNQEQAAIFNIPNGGTTGSTTPGYQVSSSATSGYQVSSAGTIDLPIIGPVKAAGLTKIQLQSLLTERISPYVKDPLVIIRFLQFNVNVLGEVNAPGTKTFVSDRVSIIDAISASGDMTDYGKKENVVVIREENGRRSYYNMDMRSGAVFQSPAFYLQPNDIVYVTPNNFKLKSINSDPHQLDKTRTWMTFASIGITVASLIITIIRTTR